MTTYSQDLRLSLIADGTQVGTWGDTTNANLGTLIEQAIAGVSGGPSTTGTYPSITMPSDANYALTANNGAVDQARNAVIVINSTPTLSQTRYIIAPAGASKVYIVKNNTSGSQAIAMSYGTTSAPTGAAVSVANGTTSIVYGDGTNFYGVSASGGGGGGSSIAINEQAFVATAGQTVFNLTSFTYTPGINSLQVYVNGLKQVLGEAYTETSTTSFTFVSGLNDGAIVEALGGAALAQSISALNVSYNEGGTGAVNTTVQAKLQETVSVMDFGASTSSSDNTSAIQAALTYVASVNGTLLVPGVFQCASALSLTTASGVTIKGTSPTLSGFQYTGTGSGTFLSFTSCENIHLDTVEITYTSSSFTGTLVAHTNGARNSFFKCKLAGVSVSSAAYLLNVGSCITTECIRTRFSGGQRLVNGGTTSTTIGFTNCDFDTYAITAIYRPTQAWSIINCAFENAIDTTGSAVLTESADNIYGLTISGCWMSDTTSSSAFTWIYLGKVNGCSITGNYINGTGYLNSTGITIAGASSGVNISGNYFGSLLYGVNLNSSDTTYSILANTVTAGTTEVTGILQQSSGLAQIANRIVQTGAAGFYLQYPTYGTSIAIDASASNNFVIGVTNNTGFTISNPTNASAQYISIKIVNTSGGAMGTITWGSNYRLSAWTNPATGYSRTIDFVYNGAVWVEKSRTPADVPN